jgi:hypothetical protein
MNRYVVSAAVLCACALSGCHHRDTDGTEPGTHPATAATAGNPHAPTNNPPASNPPPPATSPTPASTSAQPASGSTR